MGETEYKTSELRPIKIFSCNIPQEIGINGKNDEQHFILRIMSCLGVLPIDKGLFGAKLKIF